MRFVKINNLGSLKQIIKRMKNKAKLRENNLNI